MADVDPGDILRLGCALHYDGIYDIVNVWHVLVDDVSGITWAQATVSIQTWCNALYDDLKATLSDNIGTLNISVANVTQVTTLGSIAWSPTWSGADAGDVTPAGACCFAWARTYKPRVQMRKYFGVFTEGGLTNGVWVTAVRDDCEAAMTYAIAESALGGSRTFQGVVYNRTLGTYQKGVSVDSTAEPAYQRRRTRGRGS